MNTRRICARWCTCAWLVVVPRRVESAAPQAAPGVPAQADEREPAVVGEIGPERPAERAVLRRSGHRGAEGYGGSDAQRSTHPGIMAPAKGSRYGSSPLGP